MTSAQDRGQARSMVISKNGIVAAESPLAAQAGVQILEHGGNAVDAAIATNAMMGVVAPMMNGIGGDLFAIVYDAKANKLYGINASGWAPKALTPEYLHKKGLRDMPQEGIDAVTVPGAVDGWQKLADRFGRKKACGGPSRRHPHRTGWLPGPRTDRRGLGNGSRPSARRRCRVETLPSG